MKLICASIRDNHYNIPIKYTCDGENKNPQFELVEIPPKTQSLVLIMDDPDNPSGILNHWIVWNINPKTNIIPEGHIPVGVIEGVNGFGKNKYSGPCPSIGTHVYLFKLYAIDAMLPNDKKLGKNEIRRAIKGHIIDKALFKGFYCRPFSGDI